MELDLDFIKDKLELNKEPWSDIPNNLLSYPFIVENLRTDRKYSSIRKLNTSLEDRFGYNFSLSEFIGDTIFDMILSIKLSTIFIVTAKEASWIRDKFSSNDNFRCMMISKNLCKFVKNPEDKHCANVFEMLFFVLYTWLKVKNVEPFVPLSHWVEIWYFTPRIYEILYYGYRYTDCDLPMRPVIIEWRINRGKNNKAWRDFGDTKYNWTQVLQMGNYLGIIPANNFRDLLQGIREPLVEIYNEKNPEIIEKYSKIMFPGAPQEPEYFKLYLDSILEGEIMVDDLPIIFNFLDYLGVVDLRIDNPTVKDVLNYVLDY